MRKRGSRLAASSVDEPGQDSFLDVVANIVGILIILVVVVGVRASRLPATDLPTAAIELEVSDRVESRAQESRAISNDVFRLYAQVGSVAREAQLHRQSRDHINTLVKAAEAELADRRSALDHDGQADFDLRSSLDTSQAELDRLLTERLAVNSEAAETVEIESLPTPIGTKVDRAAHFQLRGGRIAFIPHDRLVRRLTTMENEKARTLQSTSYASDSVGPVEGFRLSYHLRRFDVPDLGPSGTSHQANRAYVLEYFVLPISDELGETLEEALAPNSQFRHTLQSLNPRRVAITLWTYDDSFADFRTLKRELFKLGYKTACRPLPKDGRIGFSNRGTSSVAQ